MIVRANRTLLVSVHGLHSILDVARSSRYRNSSLRISTDWDTNDARVCRNSALAESKSLFHGTCFELLIETKLLLSLGVVVSLQNCSSQPGKTSVGSTVYHIFSCISGNSRCR